MKSNMIISQEQAKVFEQTLDMIDSSIQELRKLAHNLMPETLVKFGLDETLKDYCNSIDNAGVLNVKYQSFGMNERFDNNTEIIIYRIIQELLSNTVKHAKASEALVQLVNENNRLIVTVKDNGEGFDRAILSKTKGSGLSIMHDQVEYLNGKIEIQSEPGKGTSVNIEVNL
jgi:two-component system NarL family sensor kinase